MSRKDATPQRVMSRPTLDTEFFVIGNGAHTCVVAWDRTGTREPYSLLLGLPGMMARKEGTLLWHPEHGLRRTMLTVIVDGVRHAPQHASTSVSTLGNTITITWMAGDVRVEEDLFALGSLTRDVSVSTDRPRRVQFEAALYPNPLLFSEFSIHPCGDPIAEGLLTLSIHLPGGRAFERFVRSEEIVVDGERSFPWMTYPCSAASAPELGGRISERYRVKGTSIVAYAAVAIEREVSPRTRQLQIARRSLRAAVGHDGRFNASLFQYEFEWGLDAAMVARAAALAGDRQLAAEILDNILTRLSNDEGMITEAGRFRGGELSELNGNGAVLDAVWQYWLVTRDTDLVRGHWERIVAIAEYPLREEFQHASGLVRTRRDFWERFPWQGVGDGFELGHQVFCAVGLRAAAELALVVGDVEREARWRAAGERIRTAMLEHPTHSLVENGRFIRRRLVDGTHERALVADASWYRDDYAPYLPQSYDTAPRSCEPDVTGILPIMYGLVDARSEVALGTVDALEALWSPNGIGGYARYDIASEPDSPGPWPFATAMVAHAQLLAGRTERARRTIDWLLDAAGAGGTWLEYYGHRESPPHPPTGIIVWAWAQYVMLAIEGMLGVEIERESVIIAPRTGSLAHGLVIGDHTIRIRVGENVPVDPVRIALPLTEDHDVTFA
jgi:hypothetical protein